MRFSIIAALVGCAALQAGAASYPSPEDWRDENIYFIFTDRFNDGDPSNDNAESGTGAPYAPTNSRGINGGDFKGIEKKVDYIKSLGATAIWITPMVRNIGGSAYHGYGAQDFYQLAPHLGSLTDLSNMVAACHSRGIKVVLDIVVNHSGNLINSSGSGYPNFKTPPAGYVMKYASSSTQHASPFNITNASPAAFTSIFHTNGVIQDFSVLDQVEKGELSNLDDFNTQLTYVRTNMANIYKYWIQTGDLDGFRIDTVKHVESGFWTNWCPAVHGFATSIGKSNLFMFGEVYDGSDSKCGYYTGTKNGGSNFALDSVLDYPLYFMVNGVFASATGNSKQIEDHYNAIPANYDPAAQDRLVTFLDNHDQVRFLSVNSATNRLAVALTFLYTARGIPCLYYGTEQAFNGAGDPNNREDMFDGQFEQGPSLGDNFNETHPLFRLIAQLNNFRRAYPALRRGGHRNLWNSPNGPGLFAYSRTNGNQEVFVAFNTASTTQTLGTRPTIYSAGTQLINLLNTNELITVTSTPEIPSITVPSFSAKIFVAKSQFQPLDPVVTSVTPTHGMTNVSTSTQVILKFSKPMNTASVQSAFTISPGIAGVFTWAGTTTMTFTASSALLTGRTNLVTLGTNCFDNVDSKFLFAPFETYFVTAGSAASDTSPPTVAISLPLNAATITGTLNISGTAADTGGTVTKVEVRIDSGNWTTATGTTSWSLALDSTKFLNGSHAISARATDSSGNASAIDQRTVKFFNVPDGYAARVSAGNTSDVIFCDSTIWVKDQPYAVGSFGYSGGTTGLLVTMISNTCAAGQSLYQRERYSSPAASFSYLFDCPAGIYETTLLEAETYWTNENQRVFNLFIEGQEMLANFDIFAAAGASSSPVTLLFTNAVADSQMEIQFFPVIDNARASGIQIRKIADLDTDGDGIPDWWTLAYFDHPTGQSGDFSQATDDADGDGMSNLAEFLAGTNPLDDDSTLRITAIALAGNDVQVSWTTVFGKTNQLLRSDAPDGNPWLPVGANVPGTGSIVTRPDPGAALLPPLFYKVRVVP